MKIVFDLVVSILHCVDIHQTAILFEVDWADRWKIKSTADPVQDLYLRELRAYKPKPTKAGDAEAHVQKFSAPKPPPSPEEASIADELKSYESQQVEVEGQAAAGEAAPQEESWFEEDEEDAPTASH